MAIPGNNRDNLKSYFVKNSIPTEGNFAELIDSMLIQQDDGLAKPTGEPLRITVSPDSGDEKPVLHFYEDFDAENPVWCLSLNSSDGVGGNKAGFNISSQDGASRLFIDQTTGNVGIGTATPLSTLSVAGGVVIGTDYASTHAASDNDLIVQGKVVVGLESDSTNTARLDVKGLLKAERYVVQDGVDGGSSRGIYMWRAASTNWGIYMSTAGSNKSFNNATAVEGAGFDSYALRLRVYDTNTCGLIVENGAEDRLLSIRGGDGLTYIRGNLGIGIDDPQAELDVAGIVQATEFHGKFVGDGSGLDLGMDAGQWKDGVDGNSIYYDEGNVGIGTDDPQAELDVRGSIKMGPDGSFYAMAAAAGLRVIRGTVRGSSILAGEGYNSTLTYSTLSYIDIKFSREFSSIPTVTVTPEGVSGDEVHIVYFRDIDQGGFNVDFYVQSSSGNIVSADREALEGITFHFIAIGGI